MKTKTFAGIISLFSVLGLELLLDNMLLHNSLHTIICFNYGVKPILVYLCTVGLLISIFINRTDFINISKFKDRLKNLIKNTISGSILEILFVIYFLLHLTWIPDSIFDCVKEKEYSILHPAIFLSGFIIVLLSKPSIKKDKSSKPLVLLTSISDIRNDNIDPFLKPFHKFSNFERVIIFIDKGIAIDSSEIPISPAKGYLDHKEDIESFIQKKIKEIPSYQDKELVIDFHICNYFNLSEAYESISKETNNILLQKYVDDNLLFNLTPGNKYISIALALNSINGSRQYCYLKPPSKEDPDGFEHKALDIFDIKDIFSELLST